MSDFRTGVKKKRAVVRKPAVLKSFTRFFSVYCYQWIEMKARKKKKQPVKILKKMSSSKLPTIKNLKPTRK